MGLADLSIHYLLLGFKKSLSTTLFIIQVQQF